MATPIKNIDSTGTTGPKPSLQQQVDKALSDIFKKVLLPPDQDRRSLGAGSKKLVSDIEAQLKKAGGSLPAEKLDDLIAKLKVALQGDKLKALDLGAPPQGAAAFIPPSGDLVSKNADGSFALAGAVGSPTHGLFELLQKIGQDPQKLSGASADRISNIVRSRGFSLSNPKDFEKLALALSEVSPPGVVTKGGTKTTVKTDGKDVPVRQGSASAPLTTGKGTNGNALNALIANKLSVNDSKTNSDEIKKAAVDELLKGAGLDSVKPEVRAEVEKMLDKIVTDPTGGQPSPGRLLSNAFVELSRATGDREWMKGAAFAHQMQATVDKLPPEERQVQEQILGAMTAAIAGTAAQAKLGKLAGAKVDVGPSDKALGALVSMLQGRGVDIGQIDVEKTLREARAKTKTDGTTKTETPKGDATKIDGAKTDATPKLETQAQGAFNPKIEAQKLAEDIVGGNVPAPLLAAYEAVLKKAGSTDPQAVANAAFAHIEETTGVKHPYAEYLTSMLEAANSSNPEVQAQLKQMGIEPEKAGPLVRQTALSILGEAVKDPKAFQAACSAQAQQQASYMDLAQGSGVNGGGMAGGISGQMSAGGMPGAGMGRQVELKSRVAIGSMILNDPSLTVEDKLFLFMMWMATFADKDMLEKAKELADIDRKDEMKTAMQKRTQDNLQKEQMVRGTAKKAADEAKGNLDKVNASKTSTPEQKKEAENKFKATFDQFNRSVGREDALKNDLNKMRMPEESPQKSRDVVAMELRRIDQWRGQIMDFVKSFLEDRNRRMKEIWR